VPQTDLTDSTWAQLEHKLGLEHLRGSLRDRAVPKHAEVMAWGANDDSALVILRHRRRVQALALRRAFSPFNPDDYVSVTNPGWAIYRYRYSLLERTEAAIRDGLANGRLRLGRPAADAKELLASVERHEPMAAEVIFELRRIGASNIKVVSLPIVTYERKALAYSGRIFGLCRCKNGSMLVRSGYHYQGDTSYRLGAIADNPAMGLFLLRVWATKSRAVLSPGTDRNSGTDRVLYILELAKGTVVPDLLQQMEAHVLSSRLGATEAQGRRGSSRWHEPPADWRAVEARAV